MKYDKSVVKDFARRTQINLSLINSIKDRQKTEVYEVTQLINSMLGLLVFPMATFYQKLPDKSLAQLEEEGWPKINLLEGDVPCKNLKMLIRYLRNGIAHCNIKFLNDNKNEIIGLEIWNRCNSCDRVTWKARLSTSDLRVITDKFIQLLQGVVEND